MIFLKCNAKKCSSKASFLYCLVTFCLLHLKLNQVWVECDPIEYDLIHSILRDYDMSIRPSLTHNSTLNVTFGLALIQLIDVDERNMIITTNCWLTQNWIDHKLKWDPSLFNNIQSVHVPAEKIWKPDILLVNNADSWAKISSISTNAILKYDGNVTWLSTVIFKSSCSINVKYFPFDEQSCDMIFASWTFDGFHIDINVNSGEGDVTNYIKNGEWHLVKLLAIKNLKMYSCCEEPYPELYYKLIIRRRPLYYVFNLVFPCILITLVAFLGFYLPPGSNEKVSIGITTLLSLTVFLMLVAESMPPTSEQLPLLGIYYAVTIGIVSLSSSMAVVTLNINNKGSKGRKVPDLIRIIFFNYLARILRTELKNEKLYNSLKKWKEFKMDDDSDKNKTQDKINFESIAKNISESNVNVFDLRSKFENRTLKLKRNSSSIITKLDEKSCRNVHANKGSASTKLLTSNNELNTAVTSNQTRNADAIDKYELIDQLVFNTNKLQKQLKKTATAIPNNSYDTRINKDESRSNSLNEIAICGKCSKPSPPTTVLSSTNDNKNSIVILNQQISKYNQSNLDLATPISIRRLPYHQKRVRHDGELQYFSHNANCRNGISLNEINLNENVDANFNTIASPCSSIKRKKLRQHQLQQQSLSNRSNEFLSELEKILSRQFNPLVVSLMRTINQNEECVIEKEKEEIIQNEWSDVAMILDHILCYIFCVITLASCLIIFSNSPHVFSQW